MKVIPKIRLCWEHVGEFLGEQSAFHKSSRVINSVPGVGYRKTLLLFLRAQKTKINGDICESARG